MAAPALKPCPVCATSLAVFGKDGSNNGLYDMDCLDCGFSVSGSNESEVAADWNRLSDIAAARTRAAVREALGEAASLIEAHVVSYGQTNVLRPRIDGDRSALEYATAIRAQIARLDAAPSAQEARDAD